MADEPKKEELTEDEKEIIRVVRDPVRCPAPFECMTSSRAS